MKRLVLASILAACGSDPITHADAPMADAKHPDAAVDAKVDAPPMATVGSIEVAQGQNAGSASADATATFGTTVYGMSVGTDGPCTLYNLTKHDGFSAGNVTVTGTVSTITLQPQGTAPTVNYSSTAAVPKPAFTAGATITFTAAGGPDVPAFTGSVTAPAAIAGYTPPATTVSRSGYTATWTAGAGPSIWVILGAIDTTAGGGIAGICRVTDTGSFTIPASTFAMIPANMTTAFVGVGRVSPTTVTAGGVSVTVQATSYSTSGMLTLGT
jgi:hypothetical protein